MKVIVKIEGDLVNGTFEWNSKYYEDRSITPKDAMLCDIVEFFEKRIQRGNDDDDEE